jgi:hypothetical protein
VSRADGPKIVQEAAYERVGPRHSPSPAEPSAFSAVDDGHISCVVSLAGGWPEVIQPFDLLGAQLLPVTRARLPCNPKSMSVPPVRGPQSAWPVMPWQTPRLSKG